TRCSSASPSTRRRSRSIRLRTRPARPRRTPRRPRSAASRSGARSRGWAQCRGCATIRAMEAGRVRRWLGPLSAATLLTTAQFTTTLAGQTDWEDRSTNPDPRFGHALAFDPLRGRTVLFGGSGATRHADTWEWDGGSWTHRASANTPPARLYHALAYDLARGRTVLFGGANSSSGVALADTGEGAGGNWPQRFPPQTPPARYRHALAGDLIRNCTVLFGGTDANSLMLADTWEWDGVNWLQRAPASSPQARYM